MQRARLEAQLRQDEGKWLRVYADTEGHLTVGIGHRVRPADHLVLGQQITQAQCEGWFAQDVERAIADCQDLFPQWGVFPNEVQEILANMAFNLGRTRLALFRRMRAALERSDYGAAADEMAQSLWYRQVGERSIRLVARMRAVAAVQAPQSDE